MCKTKALPMEPLLSLLHRRLVMWMDYKPLIANGLIDNLCMKQKLLKDSCVTL